MPKGKKQVNKHSFDNCVRTVQHSAVQSFVLFCIAYKNCTVFVAYAVFVIRKSDNLKLAFV